ncbi:uncharacterized protein LOC131018864 [Salvia miltiorrhiza]|uniref:uncharacterized protein LOC131018864 n=1 Tax=Salvia miltiorrhiza TaxID=226208 RepID=UPI0025ACD348|nr:uncharacterized protein LOC131018864 [Salvia miltiorrhiza]
MLKRVWDTPTPQKARVTSWRILRNRLPTCDNLRKRNILVGEEEGWSNACCNQFESIAHVFLTCPKSEAVWIKMQKWLRVSAPHPQNIIAHFDAFTNMGKKKSCKFLSALWMCVNWMLWKYRNDSRFDDKTWEIQSFIREIRPDFGVGTRFIA